MKFNLTNNEPFEVIRTADDKNVDVLNLKTSDLTNDIGFANWPIIQDKRTSAVAAITADAPFATLTDGQRVTLHLKQNMVNSSTLNLTLSGGTTTGAKSMVSSHQDTTLSNSWSTIKANSYIDIVYESSNNRWVLIGQRDTNNTYTAMTQAEITAGTATTGRTITPSMLRNNFYTETEVNTLLADKENKKLVVNLTLGLTADKTYTEITTAISEGRIVIVDYVNQVRAQFISQDSSTNVIRFIGMANGGVLFEFTVNSSNEWSKTQTTLHTHSNQSVLDGITSTDISNWNGAKNTVKMNQTGSANMSLPIIVAPSGTNDGVVNEVNFTPGISYNPSTDKLSFTNSSTGQISFGTGNNDAVINGTSYSGQALGTETLLAVDNDALTDGASMVGYYDEENDESTTVHDVLSNLQTFKSDVGDVLIVTLSYDARAGITSSHTYTQISTAYQAGKNIFGKMDSASTWGQDFDDFKGHMLLGGFTDQGTIFNFSTCVVTSVMSRILTFYIDSRHDWAYTISDLAKINSPAFSGTPTAPTATAGTNTTQIASTAFVNTAVNNLAKTQGVGYCTTAAATTAKTATLSNYSLYTGGIVSIWFQYDVPSSATLNINSKGAKQIRLRTTSSTSAQITAGVIKAGDTVTFVYDGTYYQVISINSYTSGRLRYKLINSTNIASTTGLTNMEPDCVYVVGSGPTGASPVWSSISTMKIASLKTTGYGVTEVNKSSDPLDMCPTDGSFVPTYQIMFRASASFSSIEIPSYVKWKDNYAPDPNDMKGNYCELTIMNNIATMNIV